MSGDENRALVGRLADEVLTQHNLAALDDIFHADYGNEPPPGMGPGLVGLREWLAMWIEAFPDVRWRLEEQIADEDKVWSRSTWQGTTRSFPRYSGHEQRGYGRRVDDRPVCGRKDCREPHHHEWIGADAATLRRFPASLS